MIMGFILASLLGCSISIVVLAYLIIQTQIELKAMLKSTHNIQFVPATDFEKFSEKTKEKLEKDFFDNIQ